MVEWEKTTLESISANLVRGPFGGSLKKECFVSSGYRVYEQQDAIYGTDAVSRYYISQDKYNELLRFAIADGDFIVSCSGTIGRIHRLPKNAQQGVINQALLKITLDENKIDPNYFLQFFQWENFQQTIIDDTQGGAMKNLVGMDKFRLTEIPLPPLPEQRHIAAALSDTDALIVALEKLIAKKRNIKQGAMQELLTGKRRLPGFSGEWVEKPLEDFFILTKGNGLSKEKTSPLGNNNCVLYGELFTTYKEVIQNIMNRTNETEGTLSKVGDILMPVSTTTNGSDLAIASALMLDGVLLGGDIAIFRPYVDVDSRYFAYRICLMHSEIIQYTQGITIIHLQPREFHKNIFIVPPTKEEQTIIAEIIIDMDAEINALTAKLTKLEHIKQGMMSELLTGRIRLVEQEAEVAPAVKIVDIPKHKSKTATAQTVGHNQHFDDAVMIAGIVNAIYSDKYLIGRKRLQKCLYLLRRYQDESTVAFKKKVAGPYADEIRYKGGEPIAKNAHYIKTTTVVGKGTTFVRGDKINQALDYIDKWGQQDDIKWVADKLKTKKTDDLELLATVDMAICDLEEAGIPVSVSSIKHLIATNAEWKAKLKKRTFSDTNIARTIRELPTLLKEDNLP